MLTTTYLIYLLLSVGATIGAARTLKKCGLIVLKRVFNEDLSLAQALNNMLAIGFYLLCIGFILSSIKISIAPKCLADMFEILGLKVGKISTILGALLLFNVYFLKKCQGSVKKEEKINLY